MMDLSPQFHGTLADLHPGDKVLPGKKTGVSTVYENMKSVDEKPISHFAFSTTDETTAWQFADSRIGMSRNGPRGQNTPRSSVMRVKPHPKQQAGRFHEDNAKPGSGLSPIPGETVAPHFNIAERRDIRPGQQGTFPLNWNQFTKPNLNISSDTYNHPTDENIEKGHPGSSLHKQSLKDTWGLEDLMDSHDEELASDKKQGRLW